MLKGTPVCEGIGIGKIMIVEKQSLEYTPSAVTDTDAELKRFKAATEKFYRNKLKQIAALKRSAGEKESKILESHIQMIKDPCMSNEIETLIKKGLRAEAAVEKVCNMFIEIFSAAKDKIIRQRVEDVRDIGSEMLSILLGVDKVGISNVTENTVLVAKELTPSMIAQIGEQKIVGIVTESGGKTSHSAILTRALGIPTVLCVEHAEKLLKPGTTAIVDGTNGIVVSAPNSAMLKDYINKQAEFNNQRIQLEKFRGRVTVSADGTQYKLLCNIGNPDDAQKVLECDGEGVGLFRTEFLFMESKELPTEEEQFEAYKRAAIILKGKPLTIRTLDIGGDKKISYLKIPSEENPFMGFRAVRYCLNHKDIFKSQIRAILRASTFGDIRIMFPFITCVEELRKCKAVVEEAKSELTQENISFDKNIKIGIMIETASAALIADLLAKESDFFSIGTNDLTGYTMACDRNNGNVSYLYSALQPSVLRLIKNIIESGKNNGIPVGMCGVAVANPLMIPMLISFGLDEFSVFPSTVLKVRKEISSWSKSKADKIAQKVMSLATEAEIRNYLNCELSNI